MNSDVTESEIFVWALFFLCTLLLMIIMLNLLIAFINDSYVKITSLKDRAFLSERVALVAYIEREMGSGKRNMLEIEFGDEFVFFFKPDQLLADEDKNEEAEKI